MLELGVVEVLLTLALEGLIVGAVVAGEGTGGGGVEDGEEEQEEQHLLGPPGDWAGLVRYHVQLLVILKISGVNTLTVHCTGLGLTLSLSPSDLSSFLLLVM